MRTTIDLPRDLRRKLIEEAAARNLRGFSRIVEEALRHYFGTRDESRKGAAARLKGSLADPEAEKERERLTEVRSNWRS